MKKKKKGHVINNMTKLENMYTNLRVMCVCGHKTFIPDYMAKHTCFWCGRTIYNNNEKGQKEKFKDEMKKALRRKNEKENKKDI